MLLTTFNNTKIKQKNFLNLINYVQDITISIFSSLDGASITFFENILVFRLFVSWKLGSNVESTIFNHVEFKNNIVFLLLLINKKL